MPKENSTGPSAWTMVKRLFIIAGGHRAWFAFALFCDLVIAGLLILGNHFTRRYFDAVTTQDIASFWLYVWLSVASASANIPVSYLKVLAVGQFSERTLARLRRAVAARSNTLPLSTLETRHSGDLLSVLNADMAKVKNMLGSNLIDLVGQTVRAVAAFIYILSVNWILGLAATVLTPLIFIAISTLTQPLAKRSEEMQSEIGQVNSIAQDSLTGAMVVRAFNLSSLMDGRFRQANQQALKKGLSMARLKALIDGIALPISIVPFILAVGLGGYFIVTGRMTFGGLFAFINLLNFVVNPLSSVPGNLAAINEAAGGARRIFQLIDQPEERSDGADFADQAQSGPVFNLNHLTFTYTGESTPVLKDISLDIPTGQTVAVVGPSGSGKSTLIKLLLGYYPLDSHSIQLFGRDLNQWSLAAARRQMSFVAQDTYLFPISLFENIRLGKPGASQAQVEQAARMANIHDFIISLPQGYETNAGESGMRLSGGQRQRISLARAILKDAPILLLDEPTSALDTESESLVQQALERFTQGRTTIVIAHRLSTIKNAGRVLVLDEGQIVEQGTHEELIAKGGVYLDLYQRQFNLDQPTQAAVIPAAGGSL